MSNIMITRACNLRCPYCFADEFVNRGEGEISLENFQKALDFIVGDGGHSGIGLIGGEPTIHSKFDAILRNVIRDKRVKRIMVYTNGIEIEPFLDIVSHSKVRLLVNCNSPGDIGEDKYGRMLSNLDRLIFDMERKDSVTLGINMYKPDFEYDYYLDALKRYGLDTARVSIVVPNLSGERDVDPLRYFMKMKPRVLQFFHDLLSNGILPHYDCNKIPSCLVSQEEIAKMRSLVADKSELLVRFNKSNLANSESRCLPVIDVLQDLTAVRCFGLSGSTKRSIADFRSVRDLENYYLRTVDAFAYNSIYATRCSNCNHRDSMTCSGGCLVFKEKEIIHLRNYVQARIDSKVASEKHTRQNDADL